MNSKQRAMLRGMANTMETILYIGKDGVVPGTIKQASDALEARELIKCAVQQGCPLTAREAVTELCAALEAEPVQCIARGVRSSGKEMAEDRCAEGPLCRAGVPSGGNIVEQQGEEIFVERDGGLAAVTVRDDGALFQAAVALARIPVTLGEQVEIVGLLRRVFDAHGERRLWPEVGKGKGCERKRCEERANEHAKRFSFHPNFLLLCVGCSIFQPYRRKR